MGTARGQSRRSSDARRAAQTNDRLEHQHEKSQIFLGRDGQDGRMRGMRKPRRQETQCCMSELDTDAEMQQDTQAPDPSSSAHTPMTGIGDSTARPVARDIRDTEQVETANDEPENPGEWTPAKRSRLKSKPLVQSKRPRETPTDLEHMENDELRRMGTGSTANKRKSDQPEEAMVKEQRVDDSAMDQGSRDAGLTTMRMDEMLMDQVVAVSIGTSRVCVNEKNTSQRQSEDWPQILSRKVKQEKWKTLTT